MTLGMNSILEGVAIIYSHGSPQGNAPGFVTTLSTGSAGIPYVVVLWIVLIAIVTVVLVFTRLGRNIYGIGSNRAASELCGLPVKRTIIVAYAVSGLSCALGGVLLAGYSGQAYIGMGDNYLLPSVAIVVIGGTSLAGGKGSYLQTVAGAALITVIQSALVTINMNQAGQDVLYGTAILLMAFLNQFALGRNTERPKMWSWGRGALRGWLQPVGRGPGVAVPATEQKEA
jgi:ribose transport system permease protein